MAATPVISAYSTDDRLYNMIYSLIPEIAQGGQTIVTVNSVTSIPTGVTIGPTSITSAGTTATVELTGGTPGTTYSILFIVTLTGGSVVTAEGGFQINNV